MPLSTLNSTGDEAVNRVRVALENAGLRVMMSFDSNLTRTGIMPAICPHHGENACDCQIVILLVYGEHSQPATLLVHGQDGETWISLVDLPGQLPDSCLQKKIRQALPSSPAV